MYQRFNKHPESMNDFKIWRDKNIVILGINRLE